MCHFFLGHTSVKMCERIMSSIDLFKAVRKVYSSKQGFDEHTTQRHSVPNSFPDQLKGMWFCLRNGLLNGMQSDDSPDVYTLEGSGKPSGKVQKWLLDVNEKGTKKVAEKFKDKLYEAFPDLHFNLLTN